MKKIFFWLFLIILISLPVKAQNINAEEQFLTNSNPEACGFTDLSKFTLDKKEFITKIESWINWPENLKEVDYTLQFPDNKDKKGTLKRGSCDPYQTSWCVASDKIDDYLPAGEYSLTISKKIMCQNQKSNGMGFITVYRNILKQFSN